MKNLPKDHSCLSEQRDERREPEAGTRIRIAAFLLSKQGKNANS